MSTRNIFQKICPTCMSTLAIDTRQCACGHDFDHDDPADVSLSSEEIRLKAEELYESYLAARAQQAADTAKTARAEFAREPSNPRKAERMAAAADEARAADTALAEQSARIAEMRKALPPAVSPRPAAPIVPAARKKTTPVKPVASATAARKAAGTPSQAVKPAGRHKRKTVTVTPAATHGKPAAAKPLTPAAEKSKPGNPIVLVSATPLSASKQARVAPPALAATPDPTAFRKAQAAKAEKILHPPKPAELTKDLKKERQETGTVTREEPELPALSLSKSAPRLLVADKKKECPNCTASVDSRLNRCRCGYEFPSSETLIPPLAMSEEERAEFAKLFGLP